MGEELLHNLIYQAIAAGDSTRLREYAYAMETSALGADRFPEHSFELILDLLNRRELFEMDGSFYILRVLENDWKSLSDEQKERLLPALETAYGLFDDWMSWFVISELLGKCFGDEQALGALSRLKAVRGEGPRSLVPHGLEHIVEGARDEGLARKAYAELWGMRNDPSEQVRNEVGVSLRRLANREHKSKPTEY
jgi:hypothetical protein